MESMNEQYQKALVSIDRLLDRKDHQAAKEALEYLYQFKPVRLAWFVRKARYVWHTEGVEEAKEILEDRFTLDYCYEGIPEALTLMAEIASQQGDALERERLLCALDLVEHYGAPETSYQKALEEMERVGERFAESGALEAAQIIWERSYLVSDVVMAMVAERYLARAGVEPPPLTWAGGLPNIEYLSERLDEDGGPFIILAEVENQWKSAALAKMLAAMGKLVYLLLPPVPYSGSIQTFFTERNEEHLRDCQEFDGIIEIDTFEIQQEGQAFDDRHLILQALIQEDRSLFTVLGSGCLMDEVALAGEMKKHFERFNFQMGDIFEANLSAGWVGDHLTYLEKIYGIDVHACLDATPSCKFSIVIPARNSAETLRYTIQTCLEQDFPAEEYEILISDNSTEGDTSVSELCVELADPRIRHIKTPRPLVLGKSFEFAFLHTRGEFVLSLGSDDGLLPWALRILDEVRQHFPKENIIQWERGFYAWPGFNGGQENELIIPRSKKYVNRPVFYRSSELYLRLIGQDPQTVYVLPLLYINSGFQRKYMKVFWEKTGRMWDGGAQDIYTGIANVLINSSVLNLQYPLSIAGMSSRSTGAVASGDQGNAQNRALTRMLSSGVTISQSTLSMPEKLSAPGTSEASLVTRFLYRCAARGLISLEQISQRFDMKALFIKAVNSSPPVREQKERELRKMLYVASLYGEGFLHWCDETIFEPGMRPRAYSAHSTPKFQEGRTSNGGEVLDASKFDVKNVAQAAHLFVERFGPVGGCIL